MPQLAALQLRVHGAENIHGASIKFRTTTKERINAVLQREVGPQAELIREVFRIAYPWGSGRAANSIKGSASNGTATFYITAYKEVKFLTKIVPGSDFRGTPYVIAAKRERMVFYWKRIGRMVAVKQVVHPGFGGQGDVLQRMGLMAMANLGQAVEQEVRSAVAEISVGSQSYRISGRVKRG